MVSSKSGSGLKKRFLGSNCVARAPSPARRLPAVMKRAFYLESRFRLMFSSCQRQNTDWQELPRSTSEAAGAGARQHEQNYLPACAMHSSSTSTATSASSLLTTSGGAMRIVLGPQP